MKDPSDLTSRGGLQRMTRLLQSQGGFALPLMVVAFLLFAVLFASMVVMTSTSERETASSNASLNAWNLAESGYRYVASYYRNTQDGSFNSNGNHDDDKAYALKNDVHGRTYTVSNKGTFNILVMPYWFVNRVGSGAVSQLTAAQEVYLPGQIPPAAEFTFPPTGKLKFGDEVSSPVVLYTGGAVAGCTVNGVAGSCLTATLGASVTVSPGDAVYSVLSPSASQTFSQGGTLLLDATNGNPFPASAGLIQIGTDTTFYRYRSSSYTAGSILTLRNVRRVDDQPFSKSVDTSTNVVLKKVIKLRSRGVVGGEERTLTYYQPISDSRRDPDPITIRMTSAADLTNNFFTAPAGGVTSYSVGALNTAGGGSSIFAVMNSLTQTAGYAGSGGNDYMHGTFWYCQQAAGGTGASCATSRTQIDNIWSKSEYRLTYDVQIKVATGVSLDDGAFGISIRGQNIAANSLPDRYLGISFMQYHLPTIYFDKGALAVTSGQSIRGVDSGATAIVQGAPFITRGTWGGGGGPDAEGTLRITEVTGAFTRKETLQVNLGGVWTNFADVRNRADAYTPAQNDFIPDAIKPRPADFAAGHPFYGNRYTIGPLLMVLWEKKADGTWRWLAYKDISHDYFARGLQDWHNTNPPYGPPYGSCDGNCPGYDGQIVDDNASLLVRVKEEKGQFVIGGSTVNRKYNDIQVFYGDDSPRYTSRDGDAFPYNIWNNNDPTRGGRKRYPVGSPTDALGNWLPTFPPIRMTYWSPSVDFFTHIEEPSGMPQFQWDNLNPNVADIEVFQLLPDGTVRLNELTTPDCTDPATCMDTYLQNEVGMHGFGNARTAPYATIGFADFSLRFYFNGSAYGGFLGSSMALE